MNKTLRYFKAPVIVLGGIGIGLVLERIGAKPNGIRSPADIAGASYRMEHAYLIAADVPNADVDKVLTAVVSHVGLEYGKYDRVAFLDSPGLEQFRSKAIYVSEVRRSRAQAGDDSNQNRWWNQKAAK